jgi:protein-tyrosine phosphatase
MQMFRVDDDGRLFISAALDEWSSVCPHGIDVVIDLEGGLDECIPTVPNHCLYIYFPFDDDDQQLPNLIKLRAVGRMAAGLINQGHRVLSHCGMGFNRSALMAGVILVELGMSGRQAVARLRERRSGALYNDMFSAFLESLEPERVGA